MLKKITIKKVTTLFLIILTLLLIPKNKFKYKEELQYSSKNIKTIGVYLIDINNYVARTTLGLNGNNTEDYIKELIDILIKGGKKEDEIPNGFKSIINENTKLINYELKDKILKLNFNEYLLQENEQKVIESLVFTLTELNDVDKLIIYVEGNLLTKLKDGTIINNPIDRDIGINKVFNADSLENLNKVTIYYSSVFNDKTYYIPITKYLNDSREKITIIIDELSQTSLYITNLMSFLNQDVKLLNSVEQDENLLLEFNDAILNSENIIIDEVIYTILYSIKDNYDVKNVTFLVENKEILKKVLKS